MLQMIDTYLPGAIEGGKVTTIDFTPVKHSDGCHADLVIYLPVTTYFCTDLYFVVRSSSLHRSCMPAAQRSTCPGMSCISVPPNIPFCCLADARPMPPG